MRDLNQAFADGAKINAVSLLKAGLITTIVNPVKILGQGELRLKNLEFSGIKLSAGAKAQVEKFGGKIL